MKFTEKLCSLKPTVVNAHTEVGGDKEIKTLPSALSAIVRGCREEPPSFWVPRTHEDSVHPVSSVCLLLSALCGDDSSLFCRRLLYWDASCCSLQSPEAYFSNGFHKGPLGDFLIFYRFSRDSENSNILHGQALGAMNSVFVS